ncbi:Odorant-binding protein 18a-7 [Drosophila willistoni]|uniref:Odorant-binding protein 18a-7 n=1 Tax=Drosophila willistoni TaxID=7260 RepID=B4MKE4_DROWI|nr:uncharacterized protein LOC6638400 [Drosophila willistoni]EDW72583.1 Odorant-binding protein 18a-7 [Drosophila willistoni]
MKLFYLLIVSILMFNFCRCTDNEHFEACKKNLKISEAELDSIPRKVSIGDLSTNYRCFAKCLNEPYFGKDGKIDPKLIDNEDLRAKYVTCKNQYDNVEDVTGCDYGAYIQMCVYQE